MPLKQQYIVVTTIITLIAVMALLAMFDFLNDRDRFAAQSAALAQRRGAAWACPYNGPGSAFCGACGWQGICPRSQRCPNCRGFLANPNFAPTPGGVLPAPNVQNAGLLWTQTQGAPTVSQAPCVLTCPGCSFRMSCNPAFASNPILCPKCPSYLTAAGQTSLAAAAQPPAPAQQAAWGSPYYGSTYPPGWSPGWNCNFGYGPNAGERFASAWAAQPAAFADPAVDPAASQQQAALDAGAGISPGASSGQPANWGAGYGRGLNPFCPLR